MEVERYVGWRAMEMQFVGHKDDTYQHHAVRTQTLHFRDSVLLASFPDSYQVFEFHNENSVLRKY
jgi:hypothetical protein